MTDLVQTPANVLKIVGSQRVGVCGTVAIVAGQTVYGLADGTVELCEKDQTAVEAACDGIALSNASPGQPVVYQVGGNIDVGATLAIGEVYCVGAAPGSIAPTVDVIATEFQTVLGVAITGNNLKVGIIQSGVASA